MATAYNPHLGCLGLKAILVGLRKQLYPFWNCASPTNASTHAGVKQLLTNMLKKMMRSS